MENRVEEKLGGIAKRMTGQRHRQRNALLIGLYKRVGE
jgi:hypothetical protein